MRKAVIIGALLVVAGLAGVLFHVQQRAAFADHLAMLVQDLAADAGKPPEADGPGPAPPPEPLARFLSRSGSADKPPARLVYMRKRGEIRFSRDGDWFPMRAEEYLAVSRPGFVWIARVTLAPGVILVVADSHIAGTSRLEVRLLGSIPLYSEEQSDGAENQLSRYLAELIWSPDSFQVNPALRYGRPEDGALRVAIGEVSARYAFDEDGNISAILIANRPRETDEGMVPTAWEGRYDDYAVLGAGGGIRLPVTAEESWLLSDGPFAYWRGSITTWKEIP